MSERGAREWRFYLDDMIAFAEKVLLYSFAYSGLGRFHKQQGNREQAREYLTKALEIFERLGTLIEPDKVRKELAELPEEAEGKGKRRKAKPKRN